MEKSYSTVQKKCDMFLLKRITEKNIVSFELSLKRYLVNKFLNERNHPMKKSTAIKMLNEEIAIQKAIRDYWNAQIPEGYEPDVNVETGEITDAYLKEKANASRLDYAIRLNYKAIRAVRFSWLHKFVTVSMVLRKARKSTKYTSYSYQVKWLGSYRSGLMEASIQNKNNSNESLLGLWHMQKVAKELKELAVANINNLEPVTLDVIVR